MADENIVTNIVAQSDFSNLIGDLNKVSSALVKLQDRLQATNKTLAAQAAVMNRGFAETLRSTGQFSTHFVSLSSDVDKFGSQLEKGQIKLRQFFNVYNQHSKTTGGLIRDLAKQQVQLQNAVLQPLGRNAEGLMQYNVHIPRGLDVVKNKTAIAKQELQIMNRVIQEGANQLINWGKNTQWAGRQLTVGLTVPLAAFGKAAADAFRTADEQLVRLTKVYGGIAPTTSAELVKVRRDVVATAKEISKSMGASFNETIGLAADIAATGKTGNELLGSIKETTRLAVLGEVDRQDAMKATLAIQSAFKQNTDQLSESINFLNAVENQTSTTLADLVEAIPKAGPVIRGLGGSVKDLALYLTAMREGGVNAAEGANALKSALASLINPTNVAKEKFASFGIDLESIVVKNAGNLTQTLLALQASLDRLDPLQKQQALEQLFGKFQFARMNALFENLGKQGSQTLAVLDLMKASSADLAGVASRELAQVTESASGKYRRAVEGLRADLASIGDQFLTINTHLINFVDGIIKFVNRLPGPIKQALGFFGMLTAAAGPLIMLTGVLGNFFGFIIKGVSHFRSFFKGGEGWKLLTPEILAAQKAGDLVEKTFYSDAKAAAVLKQAIAGLSAEYQLLAQRAETAVVATNPTISTTSGTMIIPGRQVNPQSRFAGEMGTRAATHMNPVAGMSTTQRTAQTLFGVVPGPIPVNRRIGANPQIMATGNLPEIAGLTRISGVSTGVVASEAAKWHSMMGMLSMLSKREVAQLKKEIMTTGTMSQEFMATYAQLTPLISSVTQNAAQESAAILAQLQAGKLTLDQARAKIIGINAQMETMIAQTVTQTATSLGRTAEITAVPLLNQPVVGPTGKSNIKELFRKGRPVKDIIDRIARTLGVRTYGAGYSTETTIPKRMATGNLVPGTGNQDTVPAMLTPGEFVVNKQATAQNLPLLMSINGNREGGRNNALGGFMSSRAVNAVLRSFGVTSRSQRPARLLGNWGMLLPNTTNRRLFYGRATGQELIQHVSNRKNLIDVERFLAFRGVSQRDIELTQSRISSRMNSQIVPNKEYSDAEFGAIAFSAITPEIQSLESRYPGISLAYQKDRMQPGRRDTQSRSSRHGPSPTPVNVPGGRGSSYRSGSKGNVWAHFTDLEFERNISLLSQGYSSGGYIGMNAGGMVPKTRYMGLGGMVASMAVPTAGYFAGSALGQKVGGSTGELIGGIGGSIAGQMAISGMRMGTGSILGQGAVRAALLNPYTAAIAIATVSAIKLKTHLEEVGRVNRLAFAGGVKPLEDFDSKIKQVTRSIEDARAARELMNAQFTSAGLPGLALTAEQFSKIKDEVKKTNPELIKLFKQTGTSDLIKVAEGLKAQFVAAGDAASVANAKIAALMQLGEKGSFLKMVLGSEGVKGIQNGTYAIKSMLNTLGRDWNKDVGQTAQQFLQVMTSTDTFLSSQKDASAGLADIFGEIKNSSAANLKLTDDQLTKIRKTNPELGKILSTSDTIGTAIAKWRTSISGVTKDLGGLNNDQLMKLAQYSEKISSYFTKIQDVSSKEAQSNAVTGLLARDIDRFNKQQSTASQKAIQDIDAQIKAKEDLIAAIKKEADARKKALQDQQQQEDTKLQIQKEQLAYQDALATGNMSAAAQAQINIQRLVGQAQRAAAEKAIDEEAQRKIDALQKAIDSLRTKGNLISETATTATTKTSPLESIYKNLTSFLQDLALNNPAGNFTEEQLTTFNSYLNQLSKVPGGQKYIDALSAGGPISMVTGRSEQQNDIRKLVGTSQGAALGYDLQKAISSSQVAAGMGPTNAILTDILKAISKNAERTNISVSGNQISITALQKAGVATKAGTRFIAANGKEYEITGGSLSDGIISLKEVTTPTTPTRTSGAGGKATGGYIRHYGPGGGVYGPGTATSDSIPAYLSNGEYVVRASAVQQLGVPFMDTINKFAAGGLMSPRYSIPSSSLRAVNMVGYRNGGNVSTYNVGGLTMHFANGGDVDGRMLFEQFKNAMKEEQLRSGRNIMVGR